MKRIILLRFHKEPELVQNRIDLLRHFNPDLPIYGLYGGPKAELTMYQQTLKGIEDITLLDIEDKDIKWRFSDFGILQWYLQRGKEIEFDVLHPVEYDLVLLDKLENIYPYQRQDHHVYITCLMDLDEAKPHSNWFTNNAFPIQECIEFERLVKEKYGISQLFNSMTPGTIYTREFLEGYSNLSLPLIAFDEIRVPAIAQILGIPIKDTGFVRDWYDEEGLDFRLFNTDNHGVDKKELLEAYRSNYQKAFHPVYFPLSIEEVTEKAKS